MIAKILPVLRGLIGALALFVILGVMLWILGGDVSGGLTTLIKGATGDKFAIARTLVRATPLCLCGLGVVIAWRAGMYNIGGEGQYLSGAITAAFFAKAGIAVSPLLLLAGIIGGGLLGAFAGWLHVVRGVQVVISTILLNFIAVFTLEWALRGPLQESKRQLFISQALPKAAMLPRFDRQTDLHAGIFVALAAAMLIWAFLRYSRAGLRLRIVGHAAEAARTNRIPVGRVQIAAMALSGALCGLAGAVDYAGLTGRLADGFSQGWGFIAIPVALLGGLTAWGTAASSVFFGGLFAGADVLNRASPIGSALVPAIQGITVLAYLALRHLLQPRTEAAP